MSGITIKNHWKKHKVFLMKLKQICVTVNGDKSENIPCQLEVEQARRWKENWEQ